MSTPPKDHVEESPANSGVLAQWLRPVQTFLHLEAAGGIVLMVFAAAALVWANSPAAASYEHFWHTHFFIGTPTHAIDLSLAHWVNDALMAVFFLLVGLEIKREVLFGELSSIRRAALPLAGALGGTVAPALIYVAIVLIGGHREMLRGWAVPMATDIAFALGVLALLGRRAPPALKIFLVALAIADDLAAVLVIAIFYTSSLNLTALFAAGAIVFCLAALNRLGVRAIVVYLLLGVGLWVAVFSSGIHATIAGVALALTIPANRGRSLKKVVPVAHDQIEAMNQPEDHAAETDALFAIRATLDDYTPPLVQLEHALHPWVTFVILPLFALANAGVPLAAADALLGAAPIGIAFGLVVGKPLGVFAAAMLAIRSGFAELPGGVTKRQLFGVCCLCGIGFTMSIFIAALAFDPATLDAAKLAVLIASLASAVAGAAILLTSRAAAGHAPVVRS